MLKNKKGFTLVELMVIIVITSLLSFSVVKLVDSSKTQQMNNNINNNISYTNTYFKNIDFANISVNSDNITNLNKFNEDGLNNIDLNFNIPFISLTMTGDVVGNNIFLPQQYIKEYNINNNKNKDGILEKFIFTDKENNKINNFSLVANGKIGQIILFNIPDDIFNSLIINHSFNSLNQNDYTIYNSNGDLIYSKKYNESLGKYDIEEHFNLLSGLIDYKIIDIGTIPNDLSNNNLNIFKINILGESKQCILLRNKGSSYFNDIVSKNLIYNNLLGKTTDFKNDEGLKYMDSTSGLIFNGSNYCDYNNILLLLQNY